MARALAERALLTLLSEVEDDYGLVVLGGLVPEVLTAGHTASPGHLGTADVDVLVNLVVDRDRSLAGLEKALRRGRFEPTGAGWQWVIRVDGQPVRLELLCDIPTMPANEVLKPNGTTELRLSNLRGTGYVARDCEWREISGELRGRVVSQSVRFAGLEGYLMAKLFAARHRGLARDYYDLVHVLLYNDKGGPGAAGQALGSGTFKADLSQLGSYLAEVDARFTDPGDIGPRSYAEEATSLQPDIDGATLRADAVSALAEFLAELRTV